MTMTRAFAAACLLLATPALAREPGVPTAVPPGNTMGLPVAVNPPPGLYFGLRSGYWDAKLKEGNGDDAGQDNTFVDTAPQLLWVPGVTLLGGDLRAYVTAPILYNDQTRGDPFPPPLQGSLSDTAFGNVEISPFGLSWQPGPGVFTAAWFTVFAPTSDFDPDAPINAGGDFWTFSPNLALSYMRDGWNLTAHAAWFVNTRNRTTDYLSGDEILVNLTGFRDFGGWSAGPVGYWRAQLNDDDNGGSYYGGTTEARAEQAGLGAGVSKRFGAVDVNVNLTGDLYTRNTVGGTRLWLNLTLPIGAPRGS